VNDSSAHPNVLKIVETLLGGPIKKPKRNRGIYSIFPRTMTQPRERSTTTFDSEQKGGEPPEAQLNPHLDMQPFEMGGATYFSKIGPRSGGFTVCERQAPAQAPCQAASASGMFAHPVSF